MKKLIIALLIPAYFLLSASSCSKHENRESVPDEVVEQFDEDHKGAEKVYWAPKEQNYEATFIEEDVEKVVIYSPEAKPLRLEYVVVKEAVPVVVINRLEKKYPRMEIEHIAYIEVPRREPYYVVRVKQPTMISNVEITLGGVFIRRVVIQNLAVKVKAPKFEHEHDDCDHHHKHKHKHKKEKGHGHGHCDHDDHDDHHDHEEALIEIKF